MESEERKAHVFKDETSCYQHFLRLIACFGDRVRDWTGVGGVVVGTRWPVIWCVSACLLRRDTDSAKLLYQCRACIKSRSSSSL